MINCLKECCKKNHLRKNNSYGHESGARGNRFQTTPPSIPSRESNARVVFQRRLLLCSAFLNALRSARTAPTSSSACTRADRSLSSSRLIQNRLLFLFLFQHSQDAASCLRKGFNNNNKKKNTKNELAIFLSLSLFYSTEAIFFPLRRALTFFGYKKKQSRERERDVTVETFPPLLCSSS